MTDKEKVLTTIANTSGCVLIYLVQHSKVNPTNLPILLGTLVSTGLIERTQEPLDRCLFTVTKKGKQAIQYINNKKKPS